MQIQMGTRLAYTVKKLEGTVRREVCEWVPRKSGKGGEIKRTLVEQPAGYMVYFPKGHAIRLTEAQLAKYGLNKKPNFVSLQGLNDPNSIAGKLFMEQDQNIRDGAYEDLSNQVVRLATVKSGTTLMPEQMRKAPAPGMEA